MLGIDDRMTLTVAINLVCTWTRLGDDVQARELAEDNLNRARQASAQTTRSRSSRCRAMLSSGSMRRHLIAGEKGTPLIRCSGVGGHRVFRAEEFER